MSRTFHHRAQKHRWCGWDLWNRRPMSGQSRTPENKALSRKIERAQKASQLKSTSLDDWEDI